MRVFDASALLNIIRSLGPDSFSYLRGNFILTLTPYEIGNALWREATLLSRISIEEALSTLDLINSLYKILKIVSPNNILLILDLANKLRITYYDSSYLVASHELDAELVTDDEELRRKVQENGDLITDILRKEIKILSTKELIRHH
ncbi:MAG: type II toxin-antitoxin system VapC family toxin [Candidatus Methanodesulfokora sp.]|jgi:predicted nucleic acid-binding protein|nr:MAG: hypothetical protein C0200_01080 [Candidatus Korarchaeota archaeon]